MCDKKRIIELLDNSNFKEFYLTYGNKLSINFEDIVSLLIPNELRKLDFDRLYELSFFVFCELSGRNFGEGQHFEVSQNMMNFQEFLYKFSVFYALEVKYEIWEELSKDAIVMLKDMINKKFINHEQHPNYEIFEKKRDMLIKNIRKDPEMDMKYFDFLNGAL